MKVLERIWGTQVGDKLEKYVAEEECRNKEIGVGQWRLLSEVRCIVMMLHPVSEEASGSGVQMVVLQPRGVVAQEIAHRLGGREG